MLHESTRRGGPDPFHSSMFEGDMEDLALEIECLAILVFFFQPSLSYQGDVIPTSLIRKHGGKEVPTDNAFVLQKKRQRTNVRAILQQNQVLPSTF